MKLLDIFTQNGFNFYHSKLENDISSTIVLKIDNVDFKVCVTITCHGSLAVFISSELSNFSRRFNVEYQRYRIRDNDSELWFNDDYSLNNNKETPEAIITMAKMNIAVAEFMIFLRDDEKFSATMKAQSEYFDMLVQKREEEERKIKEEQVAQRKLDFEEYGYSFLELNDIKKSLKRVRKLSENCSSGKACVIFARMSSDYERKFIRVSYINGGTQPVLDSDFSLENLESKNIRLHKAYRSNVKDVLKKLENKAYSVVKEYEHQAII